MKDEKPIEMSKFEHVATRYFDESTVHRQCSGHLTLSFASDIKGLNAEEDRSEAFEKPLNRSKRASFHNAVSNAKRSILKDMKPDIFKEAIKGEGVEGLLDDTPVQVITRMFDRGDVSDADEPQYYAVISLHFEFEYDKPSNIETKEELLERIDPVAVLDCLPKAPRVEEYFLDSYYHIREMGHHEVRVTHATRIAKWVAKMVDQQAKDAIDYEDQLSSLREQLDMERGIQARDFLEEVNERLEEEGFDERSIAAAKENFERFYNEGSISGSGGSIKPEEVE